MKAILVGILALSTSAGATTIFSWSESTKKMSEGFTEDGFGGPDSICYVGSVGGVCRALKKAEAALNQEYIDGGHGRFTIRKCKANGPRVSVRYTRINDWDKDLSVTLVAQECVMRM